MKTTPPGGAASALARFLRERAEGRWSRETLRTLESALRGVDDGQLARLLADAAARSRRAAARSRRAAA